MMSLSVWLSDPMFLLGGLSMREVCFGGGEGICPGEGVCLRVSTSGGWEFGRPLSRDQKSGQCASWNCFRFSLLFYVHE